MPLTDADETFTTRDFDVASAAGEALHVRHPIRTAARDASAPVSEPIVSVAFLFMRAPNLGDYYEVAQSIGTELNGEPLLFRPAMYAGSVAAVLHGRECWCLPKKFGAPMVRLHDDTLVDTLEYSGALRARATMG